jgi:diguanylate cyclase (GGDEF)-like protein
MDAGQAKIQPFLRAALRLLGGLLLLLASPALAKSPPPRTIAPTCHAYAASGAEALAIRQASSGWICGDRDWHANARRAILRFDLGPNGFVPAQFSSRIARFEYATVDISRIDGSIGRHVLSAQDFMARGHLRMAAPLPEAGAPARQITVELVGPTLVTLISEARLDAKPTPLIGTEQIWMAVLAGILLVPLFFNLMLYRALRDRFLLWHVGVVSFMLTHTIISSGLISLIAEVPVGSISLMIAVVFTGGAASALMLASDFIERRALARHHRRALRGAALWLVFNAAFLAATIDWLQGRAGMLYLANWIPVVAVVLWICSVALARGSRAIKFLIASWAPLLIVGIWQILDGTLGQQTEPETLFLLQRAAIGLEVLIGSIGVADRFLQLRRDRDDQQVRASELARLAELDPLTGLLNRRAIEGRYGALRREGFVALAVFDLDNFKTINDRFGHTVGDHVLQAVAASIPLDKDLMAIRMGGEEFMLLLRGKDALQRAERIRQAVSTRVARDITGLDRPVTASMGLVEIPIEAMPDATLAAIYARADGLLYQAKRAGRNRMVSERQTLFNKHRDKNSKAAA